MTTEFNPKYDGDAGAWAAVEKNIPVPVLYEITDQPMTCPKCGARTDFTELPSRVQVHTCLGCGFKFEAI